MTKNMGQMTNEISREVMAMMEEISGMELSDLDRSKEFTAAMYIQMLADKGIEIGERTAHNRLVALVKAGKLKVRWAHHNGRRCQAFSRADDGQ